MYSDSDRQRVYSNRERKLKTVTRCAAHDHQKWNGVTDQQTGSGRQQKWTAFFSYLCCRAGEKAEYFRSTCSFGLRCVRTVESPTTTKSGLHGAACTSAVKTNELIRKRFSVFFLFVANHAFLFTMFGIQFQLVWLQRRHLKWRQCLNKQ